MSLPHPAVITIIVTDEDHGDVFAQPAIFTPEITDDGTSISWFPMGDDEGTHEKSYMYLSRTEQGSYIQYALESGEEVQVRALDPYDGVKLAPSAGVPQPLEVMEAEIIRGGGVMAEELDAVVENDDTVTTLMLETAMGVYVRFSGDWQLLSPDSTALDDTYVIPVSPEAIEVFDKADMANVTLRSSDLPRLTSLPNGLDVKIMPEPVGVPREMPEVGGTMVASGTMIPVIDTLDDLDMAVKLGMNNPSSRWFIAKRAVALGAEDHVPAEWLPRAVMRPF